MMTRRRARAGARSKGHFVVVVVDAVVVKNSWQKYPEISVSDLLEGLFIS
jgi:hypothetical protein